MADHEPKHGRGEESGYDAAYAQMVHSRYWMGTGILIMGIIGVATAFVAVFPLSALREVVERRVSERLGVAVHIGALRRVGGASFVPTIDIVDVRIAQPEWVGKGDMLALDNARVRVPILPLLRGHFEPEAVALHGLRLVLVRTAKGMSNWKQRDDDAPVRLPSISTLTIGDSRVSVTDDKRHLQMAGPLSVTSQAGLLVALRGTLRGSAGALTIKGGPISGVNPAEPYPFTFALTSAPLTFRARGVLQRLLDLEHFSATVSASGPSLKNIDDVIAAGLFETQPFALTATIRRQSPVWVIQRLAGTIGRSHLTGAATITKRDGRNKILGSIHATTFDFNDLVSDQGLLRRRALLAVLGPRVIPDTRINLDKIGKTDGRLLFTADRLLIAGGSVFHSLSGTLSLDHRIVRLDHIVAGMSTGLMTGTAIVDHVRDRPKLFLDLRVTGETLDRIVGAPSDVSGPLRARIVFSGTGDTIREAMAHANGHAALVSSQGRIRAIVAAILGQDLGRTIGQVIKDKQARTAMPCLIANFEARGGILRPNPLMIDTAVSVGTGAGSISLFDERIALAIRGAAKRPSGLRIADPVRVGGTLMRPTITVAGFAATGKPKLSDILSVFGKAIAGVFKGAEPRMRLESLPCAALTAAALR